MPKRPPAGLPDALRTYPAGQARKGASRGDTPKVLLNLKRECLAAW
jgi:hypothetical protein